MATQGAVMPQGLPPVGLSMAALLAEEGGCSQAGRGGEGEDEAGKDVQPRREHTCDACAARVAVLSCPSLCSWPRLSWALGQEPARQVSHPCAAAAGADAEGGGGCHPPGDPGRADGAAGGRCR